MDYSSLDDEALLRLIAHANTDALGEIYDRYARLAYAIALKAVGDSATAEEITQDVFMRIWSNAGSYTAARGKVITWIASIARNRSIDILRRRGARAEHQRIAWDDLSPDDLPRTESIEGEVDVSLQGARVRAALAALPEDQKTALALAYFRGQSHREIAAVLNLPLGTVKTRIRLAMQKLRTMLEEIQVLDG